MSHQTKRKLLPKNDDQRSNIKELKYIMPTNKQIIQEPGISNQQTKAPSSPHINQIINNQKSALKFMQTALQKFQRVTEDLQALLLKELSEKKINKYASPRSPLNVVDDSDSELTDKTCNSSDEENCLDASKPSSSSTESCKVKRGSGCLEINGKILRYNFIEDDHLPPSESHVKQTQHMLYLKNKDTDGVYCLERISRGTKVTEFLGNLQKSVSSATKYDPFLYEFIFEGRKMCVDASQYESFGKHIRNSYDNPNCEVQIEVTDGVPRLIFVSIKDIDANEELTCNYDGESCIRLNYPRVKRKRKSKSLKVEEEPRQKVNATFQPQKFIPSKEMPKEKSTRYSGYSEDAMKNALIECRRGMSLKRAAMLFKVPRSTLSNKFHKKAPEGRKIGRYPFLAKDEEAQIVKFIKSEVNRGNTVKKCKILDMAQKLLQTHPEKRTGFINGRPGPNWFRLFLRRNPSISTLYERERRFKPQVNVVEEISDEAYAKELQNESRNDTEMNELETGELPDYFGNSKITESENGNSEVLNLDGSIETTFADNVVKDEFDETKFQASLKNPAGES